MTNINFENVLYLSGAPGATTKRTPAVRAADIFNVKDFGALGDGSTDDTAAIQATITASSNNGIIFFPKGTYKVTSAILIPGGSSLIISGVGSGSSISANFHGFVFDNLSTPSNAVGGVSVIENLLIQNSFIGNRFSMAVAGSWTASGSPTNILLSGSNPGVAAGGALWITGGVNSVFIGMITSVASWPTVTVASAAAASASISGGSLTAQILQCYAAGGSFSAGAATITMAISRPAGIGTGLYSVFDYESYLADPKHDFAIGIGSWSGTTFTFIPQLSGSGSIANSIGASDRLWFAPVAGCIRYSSVVEASVRNCFISGFIGLTASQDKIVANDPTNGAAEGWHIVADTCNFTNPSGFSGLMGQTGIYFQNNSLSINCNHNSEWCAERLSGTACGIIGGRAEVGHFGIILGSDGAPSIAAAVGVFITGRSHESNLLAIYGKSGGAHISSVGAISNALPSTSLGGFYFNSFNGVMENCGVNGFFGTAYGIYIANPNPDRVSATYINVTATNVSTPANSWRIPPQAWAAKFIQCIDNNLALSPVYIYANLPGVSTNPAAAEGDEFNISDGTDSLAWGVTVTNTGSHTTHYNVRFNGTNWTVVGK